MYFFQMHIRYKDNELVHNTANRMLLPSGSLFFLHVIHNKRDGDTGIYYCLAKNEVGKTRSRNASLEVARKSYIFKLIFFMHLSVFFYGLLLIRRTRHC